MRRCHGRLALLYLACAAGLLTSAAPGNAVSFNVGSASGAAGTQVQFAVTLSTMNMQVVGTKNDIAFDPATPVVSCTVSPAFPLSGAILLPDNCTPGVDCQGARVLIVQFPPTPIPDGATLYICTVQISAAAAAGNYPLACLAPEASDPNRNDLPVQCVDGQLQVLPTSTPTRTPTPLPAGGGGGGSCEVAPTQENRAYVLLFPVAALLLRCRRAKVCAPTRWDAGVFRRPNGLEPPGLPLHATGRRARSHNRSKTSSVQDIISPRGIACPPIALPPRHAMVPLRPS
jgi:hypothetical protein